MGSFPYIVFFTDYPFPLFQSPHPLRKGKFLLLSLISFLFPLPLGVLGFLGPPPFPFPPSHSLDKGSLSPLFSFPLLLNTDETPLPPLISFFCESEIPPSQFARPRNFSPERFIQSSPFFFFRVLRKRAGLVSAVSFFFPWGREACSPFPPPSPMFQTLPLPSLSLSCQKQANAAHAFFFPPPFLFFPPQLTRRLSQSPFFLFSLFFLS